MRKNHFWSSCARLRSTRVVRSESIASFLPWAHHFRSTPITGPSRGALACLKSVESRCGAVALGRTYLLPPLSSGGASMVRPWLRFHIPLIEPDRQISLIRLSDKNSPFRVQRLLQFLNSFRS